MRPTAAAAVLAVLAQVPAQTDLTGRIADAARNPGSGPLSAIRAQGHEPPALVRAIAAAGLTPWERQRAITTLLGPEAEAQLLALWRNAPDRRTPDASVFASLPARVLVARWTAGDDAERAAIRGLLPYCEEPTYIGLLEVARTAPAPGRDAALFLRRILADDARRRRDPEIAALRRPPDDPGVLSIDLTIGADSLRAQRLLPLLSSPRREVRARAAAALRRCLRLPVHAEVQRAMGPGPARRVPLTDATVDTIFIPRLQRGEGVAGVPMDLGVDLGSPMDDVLIEPDPRRYALSQAARRRLAEALTAASLTARNNAVATHLCAAATRLGVTASLSILTQASRLDRPHRAAAMVRGVAAAGAIHARDAALLAQATVLLLQHEAAPVRDAAALLAARLLQHTSCPPVAREVVRRAAVILAAPGARLRYNVVFTGCGTGPITLGPPGTGAAAVVLAASRAGAPQLLEPLLAELKRAGTNALRVCFVLDCLGALAGHLDAAHADRMLEQLPPHRPDPTSREGLLADRAAAVLLTRVSDDHLARLGPFLAPPHARERLAGMLARTGVRVSAARIGFLLDGVPLDRWPIELGLQAPEAWAVGAAAAARGAQPSAAQHALDTMMRRALGHDPRAVLRHLKSGAFTPNAVARGLLGCGWRGDLATLAALLDGADVSPLPVGHGGAAAVRTATSGTADADLDALRRLAGSDSALIAMAAARRAATLDRRGVELARAAVSRAAGARLHPDRVAAVETALELGIDTPEVRAAAGRLATAADARARVLAKAVHLRLQGVAATPAPDALDAVAAARMPIRLADLRRLVEGDADRRLARLLTTHETAPPTRVAALRLAREVELWSAELTRAVTWLTQSAEVAERQGAYEALRTRDPLLVPEALLVHEAAFDPHPAIRALAK